jgi:hypothetical protein
VKHNTQYQAYQGLRAAEACPASHGTRQLRSILAPPPLINQLVLFKGWNLLHGAMMMLKFPEYPFLIPPRPRPDTVSLTFLVILRCSRHQGIRGRGTEIRYSRKVHRCRPCLHAFSVRVAGLTEPPLCQCDLSHLLSSTLSSSAFGPSSGPWRCLERFWTAALFGFSLARLSDSDVTLAFLSRCSRSRCRVLPSGVYVYLWQ